MRAAPPSSPLDELGQQLANELARREASDEFDHLDAVLDASPFKEVVDVELSEMPFKRPNGRWCLVLRNADYALSVEADAGVRNWRVTRPDLDLLSAIKRAALPRNRAEDLREGMLADQTLSPQMQDDHSSDRAFMTLHFHPLEKGMSQEETVKYAAEAAANFVGTESFATLTGAALQTCGLAMARHVHAGERPCFFVPAALMIDGKKRGGAVLALEHRAIFGWFVGVLRGKNHEAVVPYDTIRSIEESDALASTAKISTLHVHAKRDWTLMFEELFEGGSNLLPFLAWLLDGRAKPLWDDKDSRR